MNFIKMHGLGNDFILVDGFKEEIKGDFPLLAKRMCHRQMGIGADGLVLLFPSQRADLKMRIFNSDGSEAEMCGNAIRCVAKYVFQTGLFRNIDLEVETRAGIIRPKIIIKNQSVSGVKVDMGEPHLAPREIPLVPGCGTHVAVKNEIYSFTAVSMGNPHCVIFVDDVETFPVTTIGPQIEIHPVFPAKTNVEFIQVVNSQEIKMRVWERGAGETMACGTGACAAVVASVLNGKTTRNIIVHLPGGDLYLEWAPNNHVFMTGPAEEVFRGEYFIGGFLGRENEL